MRVFGLDASAYTGWSFTEDCVSYNRQDTSGGITQWSVRGVGRSKADSLIKRDVVMRHSAFGQTAGRVSASSVGAASWSVTVDSAFYRLNVDLTAVPLTGVEAKQVAETYLSMCDPRVVFTGQGKVEVFQHPSLNGRKYNVAGFTGNVWSHFKSWCSANDLTVAWIYDIIAIYPNRTQNVNLQGTSSDWTVEARETEKSSTVECVVYHRTPTKESGDWAYVYPHRHTVRTSDLTVDTTPIITADAGQTVVTDISVNADLNSVRQPVHVYQISNLNPTANLSGFSNGVYAIVGADNKPITPAQWKAEGGSVTVSVTPNNPRSIRVELTGMNNTRLGPYRIAESDGMTDHSALYVVGNGHLIETEVLSFSTGFEGRGDPQRIDNPNIDSYSKAYDAMCWAAVSCLGFEYSLNLTGIDGMKETFKDFAVGLTPATPTLATVQKFTGGPLPAKATAKWPSGTTMKKIRDDLWSITTQELVDRGSQQTFGRLAGSCGWFQGRLWRITSVEFSDDRLNIVGENDLRLGAYMKVTGNSPKNTDISGKPTLLELTMRSYDKGR